jgi:hypothetical protein
MSDSNGLFSASNTQTIVAVTFVLALLSLAFNFYIHKQFSEATATLAGIDVGQSEQSRTATAATDARLAAVEADLKAMKAAAAAAAAAPAPEAAPAGE